MFNVYQKCGSVCKFLCKIWPTRTLADSTAPKLNNLGQSKITKCSLFSIRLASRQSCFIYIITFEPSIF